MKTAGASASTIADSKTILSAIFTTALNDQIVSVHPAHALTRADLQDNVSMQTNAGRTGTSERGKPMKSIVQDTYGEADVLELRDFDKPLQDTYGSADVQSASGGTR